MTPKRPDGQSHRWKLVAARSKLTRCIQSKCIVGSDKLPTARAATPAIQGRKRIRSNPPRSLWYSVELQNGCNTSTELQYSRYQHAAADDSTNVRTHRIRKESSALICDDQLLTCRRTFFAKGFAACTVGVAEVESWNNYNIVAVSTTSGSENHHIAQLWINVQLASAFVKASSKANDGNSYR